MDGDSLVGLLATGRLGNLLVEGRGTTFSADNLTISDLALETTGLGGSTLDTEEFDVLLVGLGLFIWLSTARALLDRLNGEAKLVAVF